MLTRFEGNYQVALPDCGPFDHICKDLYGNRVITWNESEIYRVKTRANLQGMEPLTYDLGHKVLTAFRDRMLRRAGQVESRFEPLVVIIERAAPAEFYRSEHSMTKSAGAQRRAIVNHDALVESVNALFYPKATVRNVKLEELSFKEQINLFTQANVIIGQHGAGLSNQIWMKSGGIVIEIRQDDPRNHFKRLAKSCEHRYFPFYVDSDYPEILVETFENWIRPNEHLAPYLK